MAEPQDTIRRVNSDEPMTAAELKRAKLTLDGHASRGKTDVVEARMRVHKLMREQGIPLTTDAPKAKPETSNAQAAAGGLVLLLILFGVGSCIVAVANNDDDDSAGNEPSADEFGASVICEQFVEDRLRSPGTADFASYLDQTVTGGPTQFVVQSYVDSENGFGALLRTDYTCTVSSTDGDNWNLVDLVTSP